MPSVPVPPEVDAFLAEPNPAVVATVSPNGEPHTAATWYDWEDGRVFLNMDESRLRLRYMRRNPAVSLTVLGDDSWYAQVTLLGRIVSIDRYGASADYARIYQEYGITAQAVADAARDSLRTVVG